MYRMMKDNPTGPVALSSPKIFASQNILGVPLQAHHPSVLHFSLTYAIITRILIIREKI